MFVCRCVAGGLPCVSLACSVYSVPSWLTVCVPSWLTVCTLMAHCVCTLMAHCVCTLMAHCVCTLMAHCVCTLMAHCVCTSWLTVCVPHGSLCVPHGSLCVYLMAHCVYPHGSLCVPQGSLCSTVQEFEKMQHLYTRAKTRFPEVREALDLVKVPTSVKEAEHIMQEDLKLKESLVNRLAEAELSIDHFLDVLQHQHDQGSLEISLGTKDYITMMASLKGMLEDIRNSQTQFDEFMDPDSMTIPLRLRGKRDIVFGNLQDIYKFHDT